MSLEKLLAENLLRFGIKNLNESNVENLNKLAEQSASNALSISQIKKIVENDTANRNTLDKAQQRGQCVFIKSPKVTIVTDSIQLNAQFYNNMVSLDRGLMPDTPFTEIQSQIQSIVKNINNSGLTNLEIEITGTATSQPASDKPDKRLLAKDSNMQLDHPGSNYGGQKPNNKYLANQRANSIKVVFEKLLPTAKFIVNSKVIPGGSLDDASRYIQVKIKGDKVTADTVTINDIFTDVSYFSVNFGNGYGPSNNNSTAPDSFRGNSTDISETLTQRNDILPMYNDNFNFTGVKNIEYEVLNNSLLLLPITGQ